MKVHDDAWPSSWEELLTVLDSEAGQRIPLRGSQAGDLSYARSLREKVAVNWRFNPARLDAANPVTRPDGKSFPVVWTEPNEMIRNHLSQRAATRATEAR